MTCTIIGIVVRCIGLVAPSPQEAAAILLRSVPPYVYTGKRDARQAGPSFYVLPERAQPPDQMTAPAAYTLDMLRFNEVQSYYALINSGWGGRAHVEHRPHGADSAPRLK